jgi:hypothetical protein
MARLTPGVVGQADIRWLVTIEWGGKTIRASDIDADIDTDDGDTLPYESAVGGLTFVDDAGDPSSGTAASRSMSVEIVLPGFDPSALDAAGYDATTMTVEVARWVDGTTYESRRVLIKGTPDTVDIGGMAEGFAFTVEPATWTDSAKIPGNALRTIGANWPDAAFLTLFPEEMALAYPIVIGRPGVVSSAVAAGHKVYAGEGVWVQHALDLYRHDYGSGVTIGTDAVNITLCVAGHHIGCSSVWLSTENYKQGHRFKVRNTYDDQGNAVALVDWWYTADSGMPLLTYNYASDDVPGASPNYTFNDGGSVYALGDGTIDPSYQPLDATRSGAVASRVFVAYKDDADDSAGGLVQNGALMRGAGDVLLYLLNLTSASGGVGVDRGRFAVAATHLNRFKLDFVITEQTTPWEFIQAHILPVVPCSIVTGPDGVYPIVWRYDATTADAVFHIDATETEGLPNRPEIQRVGRIQADRTRLANDFSLQYARSGMDGSYAGTIGLGAEAGDNIYADTRCALSQHRYRLLDGTPRVVSWSGTSDVIYDDTTAIMTLQWRALAYGFTIRRIAYDLPERDFGWVEAGYVGTVTDTNWNLTNAVVLVESATIDGTGYVRLALRILDDPTRDLRIGP